MLSDFIFGPVQFLSAVLVITACVLALAGWFWSR
jgi:hypothetical protein